MTQRMQCQGCHASAMYGTLETRDEGGEVYVRIGRFCNVHAWGKKVLYISFEQGVDFPIGKSHIGHEKNTGFASRDSQPGGFDDRYTD